MSYDGMMTRAITYELQHLIGGRISKIHQPFKTELIMTIRAQGKIIRCSLQPMLNSHGFM